MTVKGFLFIVICCAAAYYKHKLREEREKNEIYFKRIQKLVVENTAYRTAYETNQDVVEDTKDQCSILMAKERARYKEAVKFAMICAHPDEPRGNQEMFIKYKELYESIKL